MGYKFFFVLVDYFMCVGIVVMCYDDCGVGCFGGKFVEVMYIDFVVDGCVVFEYLKMCVEIDLGYVGLLGYSEGVVYVLLVVMEVRDVVFVVLLVGVGVLIW